MRIIRRSQPPPYKDYRRFKPFLREDFNQRCAYCTITEYRWGADRNFVVEHFRPKSKFPDLICEYTNLYYACNSCNDYKGDEWPTENLRAMGLQFGDPCASDLYIEHLVETNTGRLLAATPCGRYTLEKLRLNRSVLVEWRRERRELRDELVLLTQEVAELRTLFRDAQDLADWEPMLAKITAFERLADRLSREYADVTAE